MPEYDPVQKISIVPRGQAGGLTFFAPSEERLESGLYSKTYLENQLSVALGGRVAEEVIFGEDDVTTGASSDFMQVRGESCRGIFSSDRCAATACQSTRPCIPGFINCAVCPTHGAVLVCSAGAAVCR